MSSSKSKRDAADRPPPFRRQIPPGARVESKFPVSSVQFPVFTTPGNSKPQVALAPQGGALIAHPSPILPRRVGAGVNTFTPRAFTEPRSDLSGRIE